MGSSGNLLGFYRLCTRLDDAARMGTFTNYTQLGMR